LQIEVLQIGRDAGVADQQRHTCLNGLAHEPSVA
jgi:hypothetical protein